MTYRQERWKSEGIQVGGIQSKRGVLGHWFDKYVPSPRYRGLTCIISKTFHLSSNLRISSDEDYHPNTLGFLDDQDPCTQVLGVLIT
jgi:hypothetical protein